MGRRTLLAVAAALLLGGCASGAAPDGELDGEELFRSSVLEGNAGCITCHSLDPDRVLVGPSLHGVATRAATRVEGMSAADYLRTSILEPSAYVVDGFAEGQMLDVWSDDLSDTQVDALIGFLLTLEQE